MFHTTKDGNRMLVSDMEDTHLKNTISCICNRIKSAYKMYKGEFSESVSTIASGIDIPASKERSKGIIQEATASLGTYVMEAVVRGIDVRSEITETLGRSSKTSIETEMMKTAYQLSNAISTPEDIDIDDIPF